MTSVTVAVVGGREVALEFADFGVRSTASISKIVTHYGHLLRTQVMRNASGRPGPNVITGDYRRSITVEFIREQAGSSVSAVIGSNNPQARRLEFGFHGEDSLGRHYNQAPLPHFGPAFDFISPQFETALRSSLG